MAVKRTIEPVITNDLQIGESPLWDPRYGALWFVDILRCHLYRYFPDGTSPQRFQMPSSIGSVALASHGRLIVSLRTGVHLFDPATGNLEFIVHPEPERVTNRLNDGKIGPDGAFWMGSMSETQPFEPTGRFYRIDPSGAVRVIRDAVHVSNGLAWSPDGRIMYHVDSVVLEVLAYDFDKVAGQVSLPKRFASIDATWGHVDGAAIDERGNYWFAGVTSGKLICLSPTGRLIESIELPTLAPTMPCFGGDDLKTLYVTSMTQERDGRTTQGTLLRLRVDIPGLPPVEFGTAI